MSDSGDEYSLHTSTKIPRFHGRRGEDYGLWRLRLRAACRVKGIWNVVNTSQSIAQAADVQSSTSNVTVAKGDSRGSQTDLITRTEKASGLIISALGNAPLRIVADVDGDSARMLQLLDARYASNRTVSRIAVQTQLYRMSYKNQDMAKYIDDYTALYSQLEFMGKEIAIPESHKAPMLLASIDPTSNMEPIAAALRTKDADDLTWDYVATTLIDEYNARSTSKNPQKHGKQNGRKRSKKNGKRNPRMSEYGDDASSAEEETNVDQVVRTLAAALDILRGTKSGTKTEKCEFCGKNGHSLDNCFLNPENPDNRLTQKMKDRMMVSQDFSQREKRLVLHVVIRAKIKKLNWQD